MQLGFVIDHSSCIGCHACTVACKSENDVPLGNFRTWVKYTEQGQFPKVRRSFAVLRCNQCSQPPCVDICPTGALFKRKENGVVDLNYEACIGCKSCMQACPYDALYINEHTGTAEKCHFCNHRTEVGLAPACAVVCPTEAIIPGDFDDPTSMVSQKLKNENLKARKTQAGTSPNVWYQEVSDAGIDPQQTNAAHGYIWSEQQHNQRYEAELFQSLNNKAQARTVYDVPRNLLWGQKISAYLITKSLAAGIFASFLPSYLEAHHSGQWSSSLLWNPFLCLLFLAMTMLLLITDLKKPERFWFLITRPNFSSWLCKGGLIITAYGFFLSVWALLMLTKITISSFVFYSLLALTLTTAALSAAYTAWLFKQAKGRPLWMKKGFAFHLLIQAFLSGTAFCLFLSPLFDLSQTAMTFLKHGLIGSLIIHLIILLLEGYCAPDKREEEYSHAHQLITKGPYALRHWVIGVMIGIAMPCLVLLSTNHPYLLCFAGLLALIGLTSEEDLFIKAGQSLPIS